MKRGKNNYKKRLLQLSEISLWLDSYDDIFSDFDSRPYEQRALSDDFLNEARRASRDKASGTIELKLIIPKPKRNRQHENLIKKRLRDHFKKHYEILGAETRNLVRQGTLFIIMGVILMFFSTLILYEYDQKNVISDFLIVLLQPAGWFLFWEGLRQIVFDSDNKPDLRFYEKMAECDIEFTSY